MPLCSLYILSLDNSTPIRDFVVTLSSLLPPDSQPLVIGKVVRWIISPWLNEATEAEASDLKALVTTKWDILIVLPNLTSIPTQLGQKINAMYTLQAGIPSSIVRDFASRNAALLHPQAGAVPALTGALSRPKIAETTKNLELTSEIKDWISNISQSDSNSKGPNGAVSMLNFLSFPSPVLNPGAKESYKKYGQAFAKEVGIRRGGVAKVVGSVFQTPNKGEGNTQKEPEKVWDEVALAHYPSIHHFADMIASEDYQEANSKYRTGSLRGTAILCCDELDEDAQPLASRSKL